MTRLYEPRPGQDISDAAEKMVALAKETRDTIVAAFNDVPLLVAAFHKCMDEGRAESQRKRQAWLLTPEGVEHARIESEREAKATALKNGPLPTFALRDEEGWKKAVAANDDPYGSACIRYAALWAAMMEEKMHSGETLEACAEPCSRYADVEGVTGFMYGCAVSMLAKAWVHGEELRRWHNKDSQIGTEGDKANETGGVLNPALLSIERSS